MRSKREKYKISVYACFESYFSLISITFNRSTIHERRFSSLAQRNEPIHVIKTFLAAGTYRVITISPPLFGFLRSSETAS